MRPPLQDRGAFATATSVQCLPTLAGPVPLRGGRTFGLALRREKVLRL